MTFSYMDRELFVFDKTAHGILIIAFVVIWMLSIIFFKSHRIQHVIWILLILFIVVIVFWALSLRYMIWHQNDGINRIRAFLMVIFAFMSLFMMHDLTVRKLKHSMMRTLVFSSVLAPMVIFFGFRSIFR